MNKILCVCIVSLLLLQACKKEDLEPKSLYYKSGIWNIDEIEITNPLVEDSVTKATDAGFFIFYNMIINDDPVHYLGQKVLIINNIEERAGIFWAVNGNTVTIGNDAYNTASAKTYTVEKVDRSHHIWTFDSIYAGNKHYKEIIHLSELKY